MQDYPALVDPANFHGWELHTIYAAATQIEQSALYQAERKVRNEHKRLQKAVASVSTSLAAAAAATTSSSTNKKNRNATTTAGVTTVNLPVNDATLRGSNSTTVRNWRELSEPAQQQYRAQKALGLSRTPVAGWNGITYWKYDKA